MVVSLSVGGDLLLQLLQFDVVSFRGFERGGLQQTIALLNELGVDIDGFLFRHL